MIGTVTEPDPDGAAGCASATGSTARSWPTCRRPRSPTTPRSTTGPVSRPGPPRRPPPAAGAARRLRPPTCSPCCARPRWVYRQYDHQLFLNTVVGPGADAALLRLAGPGLPPPSGASPSPPTPTRGRARSTRAAGTALVLAEGVANLACVGATPVAVVNCLNFGNPEHPEVMWQLSECIDGMAEACRALSLPVIGGNVSLYNESGGADIDPTPVLGVLGSGRRRAGATARAGLADGDAVVLLGRACGRATGPFPLEGTRWATERRDHRAGSAARSRLRRPRAVCALRGRAGGRAGGRGRGRRSCSAVHDVSGGGLAVALAEMAAGPAVGCVLDVAARPAELFTELPSRFVVATPSPDELCAWAEAAGVAATVLGPGRRRASGARRPGGPARSAAVRRGLRGEPGHGPGRLDDAGGPVREWVTP